MDWKPISTAPKNGTRILLGGRWKPFDISPGGGWCEAIFSWSTIHSNPKFMKWEWLSDGFTTPEHWNVDWTHWHPLPEPPKPE